MASQRFNHSQELYKMVIAALQGIRSSCIPTPCLSEFSASIAILVHQFNVRIVNNDNISGNVHRNLHQYV